MVVCCWPWTGPSAPAASQPPSPPFPPVERRLACSLGSPRLSQSGLVSTGQSSLVVAVRSLACLPKYGLEYGVPDLLAHLPPTFKRCSQAPSGHQQTFASPQNCLLPQVSKPLLSAFPRLLLLHNPASQADRLYRAFQLLQYHLHGASEMVIPVRRR